MRMLWITAICAAAGIFASLAADFFLLDKIDLIGSYIALQYTQNKGIAFGIQMPEGFQIVLILIAVIFIAFYAFKEAKTFWSQIGFGLVLGGGVANISDRLLDGKVTDYFKVGNFPVFNVADSCITIGIVLLFWEMVINKRRTRT